MSNNKSLAIFLIILGLIIAGCTTSRTTISRSADISRYRYASLTDVMSYNGPAGMMDAEIKIYDAIDNSRLRMVGDQAINELSYEQKQQLLLARFAVTRNQEETIVTVNFVDYLSGRPIASCRGASALGIDSRIDFNTALKKVAAQIEKTFPPEP